jgi:hypothetical protein
MTVKETRNERGRHLTQQKHSEARGQKRDHNGNAPKERSNKSRGDDTTQKAVSDSPAET